MVGDVLINPRFNQLQVRTPEGVVFHLHLAGPILRFMAWLLDLFVILVALNILSFAISILVLLSPELAAAINVVAYFVLTMGYAIVCEWRFRGQTLGKRVLRLRVVDELGLKLRFSQVFMRNILRVIDGFPFLYLVGGISMVLSRKYQRLGDFTAGTVVIRLKREVEPDIHQLIRGKYNSLRDWPHLIARLRQNVNPEEVAVAMDALLRRNQLEKQARLTIFANLANHFRGLVALPEKVIEGLSDEQLVANFVDVLYRREDKEGLLSKKSGEGVERSPQAQPDANPNSASN